MPRDSNTDADLAARRARRAAARMHHPDLGGDPEVYMAAIQEIERRSGSSSWTGAGREQIFVVPRRFDRIRRLPRTAKRAVTKVRSTLPRSVPGSRRYGNL